MNEHLRKQIKPVEIVDAAYLAGLVDGEGFIGISYRTHKGNKGKSFILKVLVSNTCLAVIDWCRTVTGLGCLYQVPRIVGRRTVYQWILAAFAAEQVLRVIQPYAKIKAEHIDVALSLRKLNQARPFSSIPEEDVVQGLTLKSEMHRLNGGPKPRLVKCG